MARLTRLIVPGQVHHVLQRGNNRQPVFFDEEDYICFLSWLREAAQRFRVSIHAYVLMPDHFHLLATPADDSGLSRMMQWLGRSYVPYFNRKYARTGTLWQGRYKGVVISADEYLIPCMRYVEGNPVRAGLALHPSLYQWSSCVHHTGAKPDPLINDHPVYWALGNTPFDREMAYKNMLDQALAPDDLEAIRRSVQKEWALGSDKQKLVWQKLTPRRLAPAQRGRPKKTQ